MRAVLVFRARDSRFFSIENVFASIKHILESSTELETFMLPVKGFSAKNIMTLARFVKSKKSDSIYHVTGDVHYAVFALPRKRSILTIHDCVFIKNSRGIKKWLLKKLYLDWPVAYAPMITTISEKSKNEIISLTGCDPAKIRVISNPVNPNITFKERPFNKVNPRLLFLGTLANKNLDNAIEALKGLSCTINIIGTPEDRQIEKLKDFNFNYIIEKDLSNEEVANRYHLADIILFPSLYEGFGLPIIEGFKAGRAVLTSNISPMKELSAGAAWLVDPNNVSSIRNTLEQIINDDQRRADKIRQGFVVVENYTPTKIASQYQQAYSDLCLEKYPTLTSIASFLFECAE